MTAAAAMVPCIMTAYSGRNGIKVCTAIPVNISDTPEWGKRDKPKYLDTFSSAFDNFPPA